MWKVGRMIEDFTYRNADRIIVISEDFKRNIMAKGVPESKIEVIYNWVDETAIIPIPRNENPLFAEFGLDQNKFYVVYAGNLGSAQNIDILLEAANLLHDNSDIQFLVFGAEKQAEPYITKAKHMQLSNLKFLPLQPYEKVSCVYSLGDVAVVSCKQGFGDIAMPSKTWSIMSAGTAVLASFDRGTDMQYIIEKNRLGVFTEAENIQEFVKAVHILYSNPEECVQMGKRGRCYILEHLTREVGTRKYIGVIESIVGH
ncbi:MAG: glycosyltransferase family 4 protein [Alistipes finegoldii]